MQVKLAFGNRWCANCFVYIDGAYTLGSIDEYLPTRVVNNDGTGHGLHTDTRGLFFLPTPIGTKGRVSEVCAFGYPRIADEEKLDDGIGRFDLDTKIRLFLFIVLYRPTDRTQTLFTMVYNPVAVYHHLTPGCLSQGDGLNWVVERGDLLGAFIPDDCTTTEDLISRDDVETFRQNGDFQTELTEFEFCPAQIDLNVTGQCYYALYLNSTGGISLDEIISIDFEEIVNVSVRLNFQVTIKEGKEV